MAVNYREIRRLQENDKATLTQVAVIGKSMMPSVYFIGCRFLAAAAYFLRSAAGMGIRPRSER